MICSNINKKFCFVKHTFSQETLNTTANKHYFYLSLLFDENKQSRKIQLIFTKIGEIPKWQLDRI